MGLHFVRQGETLSAIARRFHTTVPILARLNGLPDPNRLAVGRRLEVPDAREPQPVAASSSALQPQFGLRDATYQTNTSTPQTVKKSAIPAGAGAKTYSAAEKIARRIADEELQRTRTITQNYKLGGHNDIYDAERHARWCYRMAVEIGSGWAGLFSTGHEIEGEVNGQPFIELQMDLSNNAFGRLAAENGDGIPTLATRGLVYIKDGKLVGGK